MTFPDHFSGVAAQYAASRPHYPDALFDWLASIAPSQRLAWDAGCGSGQASVALAGRFERVVASDASALQLANARPRENITYVNAAEQNTALADHSVDLVTVAQAVHWFDRDTFYREVDRVLVADGVLAVWAYELAAITPAIDDIVLRWYRGTLGPYWPPQRTHVETQYRDIGFPYATLTAPSFTMTTTWTRERFIGYLATWSAVREHRLQTGRDPLGSIRARLAEVWADDVAHDVRWPLTMLAGRRQR